MSEKLTDLETLALAKAVKEAAVKKASKGVSPGTHEIDVLVRVFGEITRGDDYNQRIVEKAAPWDLLAVALSKLNGVTVEALVREATNLTKERVTEIKSQATAAMEKVKGPTDTACNGKVTTKLAVECVSRPKAETEAPEAVEVSVESEVA